MKTDREKKGRAEPSKWNFVPILLLFGLLADLENLNAIIVVIVLALLFFGAGWLIAKAIKRRKDESGLTATQDKASTRGRGRIRVHPRAAADEVGREPGRAYSPESFDIAEYDRQKRLEQLDGFLKNGIIDREEYRRMKERYEKL